MFLDGLDELDQKIVRLLIDNARISYSELGAQVGISRVAARMRVQALEKKGYGYPTRVQAEAIPPFLQWKDVIAKAPTGTGKTFAFGIPMVEHIDPACEDVQGLVLAPTRELAVQIQEELRDLCEFKEGIGCRGKLFLKVQKMKCCRFFVPHCLLRKR